MENKIKRLIAVGASISANCQQCLQRNVSKAKEDGVNEDEIKEAIEVGKLVRKGAMHKMDTFTANLGYESLSNIIVSDKECC